MYVRTSPGQNFLGSPFITYYSKRIVAFLLDKSFNRLLSAFCLSALALVSKTMSWSFVMWFTEE